MWWSGTAGTTTPPSTSPTWKSWWPIRIVRVTKSPTTPARSIFAERGSSSSNKIDTASLEGINKVRENIRNYNPKAVVIDAASPIFVDDPSAISGRRVLVIEDGPTLTHGEMKYGAGIMAAMKFAAAEIVDPRPYAVRTIADTYRKYPGIGTLLPAMGYGKQQMKDLEETINKADCDVVISATPIDLLRLVKFNKPAVRVAYELQTIGLPSLEDVLKPFLS